MKDQTVGHLDAPGGKHHPIVWPDHGAWRTEAEFGVLTLFLPQERKGDIETQGEKKITKATVQMQSKECV